MESRDGTRSPPHTVWASNFHLKHHRSPTARHFPIVRKSHANICVEGRIFDIVLAGIQRPHELAISANENCIAAERPHVSLTAATTPCPPKKHTRRTHMTHVPSHTVYTYRGLANERERVAWWVARRRTATENRFWTLLASGEFDQAVRAVSWVHISRLSIRRVAPNFAAASTTSGVSTSCAAGAIRFARFRIAM